VKNRFQRLPFKRDVHRYTAAHFHRELAAATPAAPRGYGLPEVILGSQEDTAAAAAAAAQGGSGSGSESTGFGSESTVGGGGGGGGGFVAVSLILMFFLVQTFQTFSRCVSASHDWLCRLASLLAVTLLGVDLGRPTEGAVGRCALTPPEP
jgi:uncharacterized membrane protein